MLGRFANMSVHAQELLGFAVVDRGEPWIGRFQRVAFAGPCGKKHHKLEEAHSHDIDDATARAWIAAGHDAVGWRVLIARHGTQLLPELVAALPTSFANQHDIPALARLRHLEGAPHSLVDELWKRLGSPMQPRAMHDFLIALAAAFPTGIASIVRFMAEHPTALPAYHANLVLRLYDTWREKAKIEMGVTLPGDRQVPFDQWVVANALTHWEEHFTPQILARMPELAVDAVLGPLAGDASKVRTVLKSLRGLTKYDAELLDRMLDSSELASLVPTVFNGCFDLFPKEELRKCIASPHIDQSLLLYRLSVAGNPVHCNLHGEVMATLLSKPFNLHDFRYLAAAMKVHSRHDVLQLIRASEHNGQNSWVWFVRELESARSERLINEEGAVLPA